MSNDFREVTKKIIYAEDAINAVERESQVDGAYGYMDTKSIVDMLNNLPSAQTDWGKLVGDGRPLADSEVIPRLQTIKAQIGGSYAIDRAVEVLEGLQEAQPKIILCKDCKHRYEDECPMHHVEWVEYEDDGYIDMDDVVYDYTKDDGYCFKAER